MPQLLGFSTGALEGTSISINDRIKFCRDLGSRAIELGYVKEGRMQAEPVETIDLGLLKDFAWVSFHAPGGAMVYDDGLETKLILDTIENLHKRRPLDLVVIHPDTVPDFAVFKNYTFPVGVENMDAAKRSYQRADSLRPILEKFPRFDFVLDINHVFGNDSSLQLAKDLFEAFQGRLKEVQMSGFTELLHVPIFETKQEAFLKVAPINDYPIIIESALSSLDSAKKEYEYILERLG